MSERAGWTPDTFEVAWLGVPEKRSGYTYRGLGLFMVTGSSPKGRPPPTWSLTHLGSGCRIALIEGTVGVAFPVATEIAEAGDWEFLSLVGWKDRFPDAPERIKEIVARHSKVARSGGGWCDPAVQHAVASQIARNRP